MARPTYGEALAAAASDPIKLLAMLVSAQEPDGTPITGAQLPAALGPAAAADSLPVVGAGRNSLVDSEKTLAWANSASANTQQTATFTAPTTLQPDALYAINIYNPSAVTALTLIVQNTENLNGVDRACELARFSCPASGIRTFIVQGWMLGAGSQKLVVQNDTVLGGGDGFSAYVRVRAL